jgi:hypothetical protein
MRRKVIIRFLVAGISLLLLGALAIETADQLYIEPRTVSSWGELFENYLIFRTQMGPIVPPSVMYGDAIASIEKDDWSFLEQNWAFKFSDGTYYIAKNSKLAKLKLPLHILVYEDLRRGEIVILSSADGEKFQGEAIFKAPEFMSCEKEFPLERYAFDELAPRRVVWEITLKSEADAWSDLVQKQSTRTSSAMLSGGGMMTAMSVPAEHTNDIWLALETQTNGINLNVFAPEGFTNQVEIYSCLDLISGLWNVAVQSLYPSGTNPAVWDATSTLTNRFLRAGNMDIDSDSDGINDAREIIVHQTDPENSDSDNDTISDYQELYVDHTDPNNNDILPPLVDLIRPLGTHVLIP